MTDDRNLPSAEHSGSSVPSVRWTRRLFGVVFLVVALVFGWLELRKGDPAPSPGGVNQSSLLGGPGRASRPSSSNRVSSEVSPNPANGGNGASRDLPAASEAPRPTNSVVSQTDSPNDPDADAATAEIPATPEPSPLTEDDRMRAAMIGTWTREYSGRWTMTIRDDGTGVMTAVPDRIWALVVGPKITIDMTWSVADGRVVFDSIKGDPESSFKVVMKIWKAHQDRKLIEVNDEQLVYLSDDGKSNSKWTRVVEKSE